MFFITTTISLYSLCWLHWYSFLWMFVGVGVSSLLLFFGKNKNKKSSRYSFFVFIFWCLSSHPHKHKHIYTYNYTHNRDSYIKMIVSLHLFLNHPHYHEGQLTAIRYGVVSNENLRIIASKFGFPRYMVLNALHRRKWVVCVTGVCRWKYVMQGTMWLCSCRSVMEGNVWLCSCRCVIYMCDRSL